MVRRGQFTKFLPLLVSFAAVAQETAMVMPKGIFRVRAIGIVTQPVESRFDNGGDRIALLQPLNRTVSASEQAAQNADLKTLYDKLNEFQAGLGDSLFQTDLKATSDIHVQQNIYALEYGLTPRISLGMMVPIVEMKVRSDFSALSTTNVDAIKQRVAGVTPLVDGLDQFAAQVPGTATYQDILFTSRGYEIPGSFTTKAMGDMEVGGKYQVVNSEHWMFSVQPQFRLPTTGKTENFTRLLDKGVGDKQLDAMVYFFLDYNPNSNLTFGSAARFSAQLSDKLYRPVPRPGETMLPDLTNPDNWDTVNRNLGDMVETELNSTYKFWNQTINVYGAYQFVGKGADRYSGSKTWLDYGALGVDTAQRTHKYEIGIGLSTIQLYFQKKFFLPFELKYGFNSTFSGKNVPKASYNRFNLYLYF